MSLAMHLFIILFFPPLLLGIIGKAKALFAGRQGPPLLQPYYDLLKLLGKGCVYSSTTSWIFRFAPMISTAAVITAGLLLPIGPFRAPVQFWGDMVLFVYLLAMARFFVMLAALDTGSSFEGMGTSREATFACLAEVTLFLNLTVLASLSRSLSLSGMIGSSVSSSWQTLGPILLLVLVSFFLVLLVENSRIPVDDPETHLELTMIHEVMVLDHSGPDFAYILYGKAVKLFLFSSMLVTVILTPKARDVVVDSALFLMAMTALTILIGVIESTMARLRLNRVPHLLMIAFIFSVFGFIVILVRGH